MLDGRGPAELSAEEADVLARAAPLDVIEREIAAATRRATVEGRADWYFGGTRVEVEAEGKTTTADGEQTVSFTLKIGEREAE